MVASDEEFVGEGCFIDDIKNQIVYFGIDPSIISIICGNVPVG
jgi:hypothetical protein